MTRAEAHRLARHGRATYGYHQVSDTSTEYPCPLAAREGCAEHRVAISHAPGYRPPDALIDAVIVEHLTADDPDERCPLAGAR